jgi:hypothetical protein
LAWGECSMARRKLKASKAKSKRPPKRSFCGGLFR